jgi:hypothetical protein
VPIAEASRLVRSLCMHRKASENARPSAQAVLRLMISSNLVWLFDPKFASVLTTIKQYRFRPSVCSSAAGFEYTTPVVD